MKRSIVFLLILSFSSFSAFSKKLEVVTIHTDFGDIVLILFDETPKHKENFIKLARSKFYNGTTFHRVIDGFMIQGGDPNTKDDDPANDGTGSPGYTIPAEFNPIFTHVKGVLAAARKPDQVNPDKESSGSQFYIVESDDGAHHLDGNYTIFGQVISGIEVVEKIASQPTNNRDRPIDNIKITMEVKSMSKKKITKKYGYAFD